MRSVRRALGAIVVLGSLVLVMPVGAASASTANKPTLSAPSGLPADGPPALYENQAPLAQAAGWPGPEAFPHTSGTGRLDDGGFYWTDFLYDDYGAAGASIGQPAIQAGTPTFGTYTYPAGPADNNGADIFGAAVYDGDGYTYWQVEWNTLAAADVPIAEWTFDRDNDPATGVSGWGAGTGLYSPGIDTALVMSSRGARVIDLVTGQVEGTFPVTVDMNAQSFVARIPDRVLAPKGTWRIRLAAGLSDAAGTGFAPAQGALPGEPNVYNVTFRSNAQEPVGDDFWRDMAQTEALTEGGNVSKLYAILDWSQLAARRTTPEAMPTGWSDRWYVSAIDEGYGVDSGVGTIYQGDEFLGRVQPYAVYVPTGYKPGTPAPLTFLLHSSTQNENQYGATTPKFTQEACQDRHSICVTTLGRGPEGNFWDTAELDFWQVWHSVAAAYMLDPTHTIISGYSMGGTGANQLAMEHPDVFAEAVTLAGGVGQVPEEANLRWVPTYLAGGVADELVPLPQEAGEADYLSQLGYRYRWLVYPAEDHISFELEDGFSDAAKFMGSAQVESDPGHITFFWNPANYVGAGANDEEVTTAGSLPTSQEPSLGIGTTGAYWLRDLVARSVASEASVDAVSSERAAPAAKPVTSHALLVPGDPTPAYVTQQTWEPSGSTSAAAVRLSPVITLDLTNVASLTILTGPAGFPTGIHGTLKVHTDGPAVITIGSRHIHVATGSTTVTFTS